MVATDMQKLWSALDMEHDKLRRARIATLTDASLVEAYQILSNQSDFIVVDVLGELSEEMAKRGLTLPKNQH